MSVRKRTWKNAKGETKEAWVTDYTDGVGKRHHRTFARKKEADAHDAMTRLLSRSSTASLNSGAFKVEMICVYRHYDKNGALLYVGITTNFFSRQYSHLQGRWGKEIATISANAFADMGDALKAEFEAISKEKPKYNQVHNVKGKPTPTQRMLMRIERERNVTQRALLNLSAQTRQFEGELVS